MAAWSALVVAAPAALLPAVAPQAAAQQPPLTPDDQAALLLNAGRRAYNDRNYAQAAERFREFVQKFPAHADAASAQYGLGLALIDGPRDYPAAAEAFGKAAANASSPDRPLALFFQGTALRSVGHAATAAARGKPQAEADQQRAVARQRYEESAAKFAEAGAALADKLKAAAPEDKAELAEWAARARCDQAEMLIRVGKHKEAVDAAHLVTDDQAFAKSKSRKLALYHVGHARYALKEYLSAGKVLTQLAPFDQEYGPHARYLLARIQHQLNDPQKAAEEYRAVIAGYDAAKKAAQQQLQQGGNALPADRKSHLESVATGPAPEFVPRAAFYLATLLGDEGKFPEAKELFAKFAAENKDSPLAPEAQARVGYCQLQAKQYKEAADTLSPLKDHARLGEQATWWLAKAQLSLADPANADATKAAGAAAVPLLRSAADRAQAAIGQGDSAAKARRAEILMDLADAQSQAGQFRDAANTYQSVAADYATSERGEEAMQRYCTALHLAGAYQESDEACGRFEKKYPASTLLPAVLFRAGENAFLAAATLDKPDGNKDERDRLYNLAVVRYGRLVEKFPEFAQVNLAKFGLAQSYYRLGKFPQAVATLVTIPDAERTGDLSTASYVQADALVRTFPPEADDAIQAAGLIQKAEQAASLLSAFVGSNAKSPLVPDAMLKLGYCYQRMAGLLADKPDRDKAIQLSREAYEKHQQQFRDHPTTAGVVFERARLMAIQGDVGGSMNELRRFTQPPLNAAPNAPLAAVRLAALMRSQGQAKEAAELLARVRAEQEAALLRDPARADWAPMLALEHAAAVREAGKPAEARPLFEGVAAKWPDKPEAVTGAWRGVQCRREELAAMTADARKKLNQPGLPAPEAAAAEQQLRTVVDQAGAAAAPLGRLLEKFTQKEFAGTEPHLRVLYEMAWCDRTAADAEVELARYAARRAARDKLTAKRAAAPAGQTPPVALLPDVPAATVPVTDGEKRARERYQKLIAAGPDKPTGSLAMFELAELVADRGEPDKAVELLNKALLAGPPQELAERVRLRLAACFLAKGDGKTAAVAAKPVADTLKPNAQPTPVQAEARFLLAEALVQQKEWGKAIELLVPFRDQGPFQNVAGVSDRAVLRLGQAYAQSNQWDPARQAFDIVAQRYPQSPWADEARFGTAFAFQNKGQFDEAVNAYQQVTARTAAEVAARAQVHVGLCRVGQKKYAEATAALLSVPYTYDYPEWSAAACYEAARAFKEMQKPNEAVGLFKRVIDDYPQTKSAPLARARLDEMK